ncbi:KH_1 domain-containing protein [Cephalotus follicularis]|uniref:KH_1 domain-containing protein n=1 Tax=Cephalotus follicularis TaxID=3775 RepID=A0A1Q3BPB2_CEPFO|nr:KH_1 domain-containing protein [Cephalotus follicularis]
MGSTYLSPPAKRAMPDPNPLFSNGPSTKRSKQPPPPLSVPPGHVSFRLLCHASRIGGVIGKSGNVIKQLQKSTGAKIRVEDAPPESPDRVITVVAPNDITGRIGISGFGGWNNGETDGDKEIDVSKAQEALVRVFERILDVAMESNGVAVGMGVGVGVVSCRLLAETPQIGSVIGKGGKVVEKIRKESGSKIRVLTDKLPACAGPTDEMVEIEGDVLAVKKALVAISARLQDCPAADKMRMVGSRPLEGVRETLRRPPEAVPPEILGRPLEAVPQATLRRPLEAVSQEPLPDLRADFFSQRNSVLSSMPINSITYVPGVHPLSLEPDRVPTQDSKTFQHEVMFKILCANDRVGGIIGKGGTIIKNLQNETGASVVIGASTAECDERLITITATENPESRYSAAQKAAVLVFSRSVEAGIEKGLDSGSSKASPVTARLVVPSNVVGCLLGKGGAIISEMRRVTGASIRIIGGDQVPKCASDSENDQVVQISGEFSKVKDAVYHVTGRLRDNLFSTVLNSSGTRSSYSVLTESSPYGRLRDSVPLGSQSSVGVSHSISRHTNLTQSMDHLGLSHSLDQLPSPPRLWSSQTLAGVNARGITDGGRTFKGGLELGSGSKSAIVTNTTVEIIVPENVIGSVYGENGSNLARLRQISGAKVIVHEPRHGSSDRIVVISGTPDEAQAAQSLLQAFILTGPS